MALAALAADAVDRERVARVVHRAENVHGDAGGLGGRFCPSNKKPPACSEKQRAAEFQPVFNHSDA